MEKLVAGGDGLARYEGIPLFVPRSAPGDRLRVRITQRRPDYGRAEIVEILQPGPGRREAPCPYFERCGGCDLQHLEDELQTRLKAEAVVETLARLGNLRLDAPPEVLTAGHWGYRLRTQLHSQRLAEEGADSEGAGDGTRMAVGYFERGSRDLVAVGACPILVPELEAMLPSLPRLLAAEDRPPRRLDLAAGGRAGEGARRRGGTGVAAARAAEPAPVTASPLVEGLPHGEITLRVAAPGGKDAEPFDYAYDARCFFQTHRDLVPELIARAVGPWEGEVAYDLYAGVGLFALPLARRYGRVVAVEGDGIAARYARRNARSNGCDNLEVEHQALETWIPQLPEGVDRVLVDPPRGGLPRRVRRELLVRRPARLTYVSCHAATLARDLHQLTAAYRLESVVLLDMFPQSGHMEAVAQLVLDPDKAPPPQDDDGGDDGGDGGDGE